MCARLRARHGPTKPTQAGPRYPPCVITHDSRLRPRRLALTLAGALWLVLGAGLLSPAVADTPQSWEKAPGVSPFEFLFVVAVIPLGLVLLITVLALLPSLARDRGYEPGQAWRTESAWFGGPTRGVAAADEVTPEQLRAGAEGTGSTSGRW